MSEQPLFVSLGDLANDLTRSGITQREAALQIKRELENGQYFVLDLNKDRSPADQVLAWQLKALHIFANSRPNVRPPAMLICTYDYLSNLRYYRITQKNPARAGAGRPEEFDWEDAEMFALQLLQKRGDPTASSDKLPGWGSKSDLANAVMDYFEKHAKNNGGKVPDLSTIRRRTSRWIDKFREQN